MTDQEINLAIEQSRGWQRPSLPYHLIDAEMAQPLDYCNDLNAMHEAEKDLDDEYNLLEAKEGHETRLDRYLFMLEQVVFEVTAEEDNYKMCVCATARQRAVAYVRTVGKWKE